MHNYVENQQNLHDETSFVSPGFHYRSIFQYLNRIKSFFHPNLKASEDDMEEIMAELEEHIIDKAQAQYGNSSLDPVSLNLILQEMGDPKILAEEYNQTFLAIHPEQKSILIENNTNSVPKQASLNNSIFSQNHEKPTNPYLNLWKFPNTWLKGVKFLKINSFYNIFIGIIFFAVGFDNSRNFTNAVFSGSVTIVFYLATFFFRDLRFSYRWLVITQVLTFLWNFGLIGYIFSFNFNNPEQSFFYFITILGLISLSITNTLILKNHLPEWIVYKDENRDQIIYWSNLKHALKPEINSKSKKNEHPTSFEEYLQNSEINTMGIFHTWKYAKFFMYFESIFGIFLLFYLLVFPICILISVVLFIQARFIYLRYQNTGKVANLGRKKIGLYFLILSISAFLLSFRIDEFGFAMLFLIPYISTASIAFFKLVQIKPQTND